MCDHQRSVQIDSDGGQASDSSVNSGNKDVFVVNLVLHNPRTLRFARLGMLRYNLERCERIGRPKPCQLLV